MPEGDLAVSPRNKTTVVSRMRGTLLAAGPGGDCVCPRCGSRTSHARGTPCHILTCPECGEKLVRG
jgi:ribosomal protein L37AE/L43A